MYKALCVTFQTLINKGNFIQMKCDEKHYFIIFFDL